MILRIFQKIDYSDIRTWLCIAFVMRLYRITAPPLDGAYTWREADVLAVARNFLEVQANIFYPRIDFVSLGLPVSAEELPIITGMEFPLLNYLIYLFSYAFGFEHWYGRLINLALGTAGIYYYYRSLQFFCSEKTAFYAALFFIFSMAFSYMRKTLPDPFSVSCSLIALYYALSYLYHQSAYRKLAAYFLWALAGIMSKIPAALLFAVLLLPLAHSRSSMKQKIIFCLASFILLLPVCYWYFYWRLVLTEMHGYEYFFFGNSILSSLREFMETIAAQAAEHFYVALLGYSGFCLYLYGLFQIFKKKEKNLIYIWLISIFVVVFFILKAGSSIHHDYYLMWWLPFMCFFAAYGFIQISQALTQRRPGYLHALRARILLLLICVLCLENLGRLHHHFDYQHHKLILFRLEEFLDQHIPKEAPIAIASGAKPHALYFAHRRGWLLSNKEIKNTENLTLLQKKGCKYALILKSVEEGDALLQLPIVAENTHFRIYTMSR